MNKRIEALEQNLRKTKEAGDRLFENGQDWKPELQRLDEEWKAIEQKLNDEAADQPVT